LIWTVALEIIAQSVPGGTTERGGGRFLNREGAKYAKGWQLILGQRDGRIGIVSGSRLPNHVARCGKEQTE